MPTTTSATEAGGRLITALAGRDFSAFADVLAPDVRMRALIPPGLVELVGAQAAASTFASWFGDAEEFELIHSGRDTFADRLHLFYRIRVTKPGNVPKVVEQHLLCALDGNRIT